MLCYGVICHDSLVLTSISPRRENKATSPRETQLHPSRLASLAVLVADPFSLGSNRIADSLNCAAIGFLYYEGTMLNMDIQV